jgi:NTE family protein
MATDSVEISAQHTPMALDLALSGGGVRAMAFHAGLLRYLAEHQMLERVRHISSVSGGSLLVGLILQESGLRWPTSKQYLAKTLDSVRKRLTSCDLQRLALWQLVCPGSWRFLFSRANVLARAIARYWEVSATLADLPDLPIWSINATTAETGRRFRFKSTGCGDYRLGYAEAKAFPLAHALAVSAAFPGTIGPLSINSSDYVWRKRPSWNSPQESAQVVELPFDRLHLYDGGLYDNLGLEPLFDTGTQLAKTSGGCIVVSDAGAPLRDGFNPITFHPSRLKRWMDVVMEQQRALRIRSFTNALQRGLPGAYLQIGSFAQAQLLKVSHGSAHAVPWLTSELATRAASSPTSLRQLTEEEFDLLCRHGRETAWWNELAYPFLQVAQ